jgi:tetratricopeptide (TPR) repeat protein
VSVVTRAAHDWLATVQAQLLRGEAGAARATLAHALTEHPASIELRRAQAGVLAEAGQNTEAESVLRELLGGSPQDVASAFALAQMLREQGRMTAAATVVRACLREKPNQRDTNLAISAIELLDDCDRKLDAAAVADDAIVANPSDARLHAYAGMFDSQLGRFDSAREHYLFALQHDERAWEWHAPIGLSSAQRYVDAAHSDFALFNDGLQRQNLSEKARAELHFALGKAHDDIGEYQQATRHFRAGNATAHRLTTWSRKNWRRGIEARLAARSITHQLEATGDFTPVFVVGMPRSGTTLLAGLLSRHPKVCNRGELPWIAQLAGQPTLACDPARDNLRRAAATYAMHARQDDASGAYWFIDKQPLNFRYIDLMLAMFPDAKIVHCSRGARDTALSLWVQCFLEDVQGYSYDFGDIALVMHDCERLLARWRQRHVDSIRTVWYEDLVAKPQTTVANLAQWIGLPPRAASETASIDPASSISTASLWQARQPVHSKSVERWRHYAPHVPELMRIPET